jgi:hypothetical protein
VGGIVVASAAVGWFAYFKINKGSSDDGLDGLTGDQGFVAQVSGALSGALNTRTNPVTARRASTYKDPLISPGSDGAGARDGSSLVSVGQEGHRAGIPVLEGGEQDEDYREI